MRIARKVIPVLLLLLIGYSTFASPTDPETFARYAYFVDKLELPLKTRGQIWAMPHSVFEGPFHTNDQLRIYLPPDYFDAFPQPFFRGPVSSAGAKIVYYKNVGPFDSQGQVDPKKFGMIFQDKVSLGVKPIPLPDYPESDARTGALGGNATEKLTFGTPLFLPHDSQNRLTGGIVVPESVLSLKFGKKDDGSVSLEFQSFDHKTTVVEVHPSAGTTTLRLPGGRQVAYLGVPNGAVYVAGDIGSRNDGGFQGLVSGRWTVAADGDLFLDGNVEYADTPEGSEPMANDVLALVVRNAFITQRTPMLMYLYATIFAAQKVEDGMTGTLFVLPTKDPDFKRQGELIWWGNYVGEFPAIMGTFDKSTGDPSDGYDLVKHYDARQADNPPPFFPALPAGSAQ